MNLPKASTMGVGACNSCGACGLCGACALLAIAFVAFTDGLMFTIHLAEEEQVPK